MQCHCTCNSLSTSFPSHQVSISTHMHSVHFSSFSMHYAQCTSRPWRRTNTGCNAVAGDSCAGGHLRSTNLHSLPTKRSKMWESWNIVGPYIPYDLLQTKGETCEKFGSDRFRNVDLYKFHTNKHSSLYVRLAGVRGVARDDQSWNPMDGIIFWYREKGLLKLWKCVTVK